MNPAIIAALIQQLGPILAQLIEHWVASTSAPGASSTTPLSPDQQAAVNTTLANASAAIQAAFIKPVPPPAV